ncbi:uncharacterized protein LOC124365308 [Homalodisca vitripennis]|uniref:uncharacterized protein LOC124365308 n=1 Tax=Homalodisca vitripennis TaxID=197043 RepID=UPI001EEB40AA|nr:uncharacterized protein LOC124365308 [Homalodisca vitripennis]
MTDRRYSLSPSTVLTSPHRCETGYHNLHLQPLVPWWLCESYRKTSDKTHKERDIKLEMQKLQHLSSIPNQNPPLTSNQHTCKLFTESVCERIEAGVELTVSPQLDTKTSRRLQVSWWVPQVQSADLIALYLTDPAVNLTAPVYTVPPSTSTGWSDTPLRETYLNYRHVFTSVCLGYWVVYWRGRDKIASSCLRTNPSWMSDHREDLGRLRLTELFIPGTHDSAAYSVTYQPREESRYDKYVFTQEESVLSQLVNGVRYLDLRLGYHKNDGGFFSHHGFAKLRHFQGVIDDLVVFLENSKDIVIIDLHHFPVGFKSEENHKELVRYLEKELSEYMATPALGWRANIRGRLENWKTADCVLQQQSHCKQGDSQVVVSSLATVGGCREQSRGSGSTCGLS